LRCAYGVEQIDGRCYSIGRGVFGEAFEKVDSVVARCE
jgi:hypothetical protein